MTISDVGEPGGDLAHDRPLDGVAVTAGADHDDDLAVGQRAQRGEHRLEGVGLVGVVDDHGEVLAGGDLLEPARARPPTWAIPSATARGSSPARAADAIAASALETLNSPGMWIWRAQLARPRAEDGEGRRRSAARSTSTARQSASRAARGVGRHRDGRDVEEPTAELVVDVGQADPGALRGEEAGLGGEVVVEVGVEVEVVAPEVEEGRDVEDDAVDPAEHERVAGDLHRAGVDAALAHHREEAVQVGRLGRGRARS